MHYIGTMATAIKAARYTWSLFATVLCSAAVGSSLAYAAKTDSVAALTLLVLMAGVFWSMAWVAWGNRHWKPGQPKRSLDDLVSPFSYVPPTRDRDGAA